MVPRVTIVIVAWNVREHLYACLRSLRDAGVDSWTQTIVVDNASADDTAEMVEREFPGVQLVRAGSNLGFSRGNNLALRTMSTEYAWVLNPDTIVPAGVIEALVAEMDANAGIGASAPRQIDGNGRVQFEAAVHLPTIWNAFCDLCLLSRLFPRSHVFARRKMGWWDHLDDRDVPGLAGSALLLRRAALDQVGLLDDTMFIVEDMDLCRRIAEAGWRIRYVGSVAITHFGGASIQRAGEGRQLQIGYQSFWLYLRKHEGATHAAILTAMAFVVSGFGLLMAAVLRWVPGLPAGVRRAHDKVPTVARSLMRWALADKPRFRHALAAPPQESMVRNRRPGTVL